MDSTRPGVSSGKTGGSVDPYQDTCCIVSSTCSSPGSCYRGRLSEFSCKAEMSWTESGSRAGERERENERQHHSLKEETKVNLVRAVIRLIRRMEFQDPRTGDSGPDYRLAPSRIISSAKKD